MSKITEAQRELLERAAADPEGVVDAPEDAKISRPLIKHGLAISLPVAGGASRLVITTAGRALSGQAEATSGDVEAEQPNSGAASDRPQEEHAAAPEPVSAGPAGGADAGDNTPVDETVGAAKLPPGGKLGKLVELLQRPSGATLEEMVAATGWQAHSVRGAMSGGLKKKQGLAITSAKTDGTRVYRIVSGEAA